MVLSSDIHIPDQCSYVWTPLGTMHGYLCILNRIDDVGFDVWLMNKPGLRIHGI